MTATAEKDINSVSIKAKADTADGAARIANAVAAAMVRVTLQRAVPSSIRSNESQRTQPGSGPSLPARIAQPMQIGERSGPPGQPDLAQAAA